MNNKYKIALICIILVFLTSVSVALYHRFSPETPVQPQNVVNSVSDNNTATASEQLHIEDEELVKQQAINKNTTSDTIHLSDLPANKKQSNVNAAYTIDSVAGSSKKTIYNGKRINIAVTGLDGRVGRLSKLADANHVVSILIETGQIEIISIPRDTYVDLEYDDTLNLNKLTICRAHKGRSRYHKELARIAGLDKIHYWVEFGFSQAIGIIEYLGYKNPQNTLQVLRSRKGLGGDDYQRCYSQGQFIRQALLGHFGKFTGMLGGVLARAGLLFVETNLTGDITTDIIDKLEKTGFPQSPNVVTVKVRPAINVNYKVYDFSDEETVNKLVTKIENFNHPRFEKEIDAPQPKLNVLKKLDETLKSAISDTAKRPASVISKLKPYFEQRAWCQISDLKERERVRNEFQVLLTTAYNKQKKQTEVDRVNSIIEAEKKLFVK